MHGQSFPPSVECIIDLNCDRALSVVPAQLRRALTNVLKNALQAMIAEKHGGAITVESKTGSGTNVTLKIPTAPLK